MVRTYRIKGAPVAQGRPRFGKGHAYDPGKSKDHKKSIALQVMAQRPEMIKGPVSVDIVFCMPRPKCHKNDYWHIIKPDIDNLVKCLLDGMNGITWKDDSQICRVGAEKVYCQKDPYTLIEVIDLGAK